MVNRTKKADGIRLQERHILVRKKRILTLLFMLVFALLIFSIIAPFIVPNDPNATNPFHINEAPSKDYPFGTDRYGRCVFSRLLSGAGTSIISSLILASISFVIGTFLGLISGYFGGILDAIIMRIVDIVLAFPQMILAIAVAGILGGGIINAMLALGISAWTLYARLARAQTQSLIKENYIMAAKLSGIGNFKIIFRYIFPNIFGSLIVNATTQISTIMVGIAGLSFLGIGVTSDQAEWGSMINESRAYMQIAPWATIAPALAIIITVLLFNLLGEYLLDYTKGGQAR